MSLYYKRQDHFPVFGTKVSPTGAIATKATLTAAYAGNQKAFKVAGFSKMNLDMLYTMGATETANTIEVTIEASSDRVNWYMLPNESNSGAVSTILARNWSFVGADATTATISIGIDVFYRWVRVSIRETGVVTNFGTIFMEATISGA